MHEFPARTPGRHRIEATLHEVLDRLYVVVRFALDTFHLDRVRVGELRGQCVEDSQSLGRQAAQLDDLLFGRERLEPERLDAYALSNQAAFAEKRAELGALVGVAAVDRRDRIESC